MPFQPGQSGNPKGRKTEKVWADAVRMALSDVDEATGKKQLRLVATKLVEEAKDGNIQAIKELGDRLDGRPVQQQILSGDPDAPIQTISNSPLDPEDWALRYGIAANQD